MKPIVRVVALAALVVLGGCSTAPEPEPKVATLETTGSSTSASTVSSVAADAGRPRERLDMTPEEAEQMYTAYGNCVAEHGGSYKGSGESGGQNPHIVSPEEDAAAAAACVDKDPLPPWEYDTANPESADFVHNVVQCLRDKGVKYVDEAPLEPGSNRRAVSFGGEQNDSDSITKGMNLVGACEKEMSVK
jgi:hypothetical protein